MSILLTDIIKRYGDTLVVSRLSLEVFDKELFVLLGRSGSGKSTLLRMIAGLLYPDSGRIQLNGRDVTDLPPQVRGTGFVFQNYSVFRHMNVSQNIEFGLRIRRVAGKQRRARREELLELTGLTGLGSRYPDQLSGGQQQRVALARALAYAPAVLLLDEPFGALDVPIRVQLREALKVVQRQLGVTTILVTHDQEEAFELGDRIGVIDHGHLLEVGEPEELYFRPRSEPVATFLGGGNVLAGRAEGKTIRLGAVSLPLPDGAPLHEEGSPVRILFRPEQITVSRQPVDEAAGVQLLGKGQVLRQTFAGATERLRLEVGGLQGSRPVFPPLEFGQRTTQIEASRPTAATFSDPLSPGDLLWIGVRGFHVLAPSGLKVLIAVDETPESKEAARFGLSLARAAGGPTTVLAVAPQSGEVAHMQSRLEELLKQAEAATSPWLQAKVRVGEMDSEVLAETQEGFYEVVVLPRASRRESRRLVREVIAGRVLALGDAAVLRVARTRPTLRRLLVCTAGGEPGKFDVRLGGRVARRAGAEVTLLYVRPEDDGEALDQQISRHLEQGRATLEALGVRCQVSVGAGPVVEQILSEADKGDYDLIVVGAPAGPSRTTDAGPMNPLLWRTARPVLIVPART